MRESIDTIQETSVRRSWAQYTPDIQRSKLAQFERGHSLGADIPKAVKQHHGRVRRRKKLGLILCMIVVVALIA